jgi:hypothetical protein
MLSCEDTYHEMAASDEDWSDWAATVDDGLVLLKMLSGILSH